MFKREVRLVLVSSLLVFLLTPTVQAEWGSVSDKITPKVDKNAAKSIASYYMKREKVDGLKGGEEVWISDDLYKKESKFQGNFYSYRSAGRDKLWLVAVLIKKPHGKYSIGSPVYLCSFHRNWRKSWKESDYFYETECTMLKEIPDNMNRKMYFHEYDLSRLDADNF